MTPPPMTAVSQLRGLASTPSDQLNLAANTHFAAGAAEALSVEFVRFLNQTVGLVEAEQLFDLLSAFALNFDCPWIAYHYLTPGQRVMMPVQFNQTIMLNYPDEWQERYFEMGYDKIDPVIKTGRKRACAFRWSEVYNEACTTEDERRVFDEAATFGLKSGISIPLHGPNGSFAIVSFSRNHEFQNKTVTYFQLAALHFHLRAAMSVNSSGIEEIPDLSPREKECILWTARGKSSWEIGKILGITLNTANFHIKNAMQKLETSSRTAAAIKALHFGIIEL
ncbi:LuxR family transcriptional regulator [Sinorhizobium sp. CCBAU 05631]|uniref:LuxR family transcriptional regulator n=1 Tax=Sinorhizobium sp. CCBAU 05631 TaxID=794846 RepID=UPI0009FD3D99|nr:LuxR family transcriptional regulator [Sinorhizobium sp. CCBAU 05631]